MPAVKGPEIKSRAARLRAMGDAALQKHLAAQIDKKHQILMESPRMGRTEQFTEVQFTTDRPEGQIIMAQITGVSATTLLA
jgi:threonylcarbamoyladenosine tRNA methylthiotransferase MtaB